MAPLQSLSRIGEHSRRGDASALSPAWKELLRAPSEKGPGQGLLGLRLAFLPLSSPPLGGCDKPASEPAALARLTLLRDIGVDMTLGLVWRLLALARLIGTHMSAWATSS